MKLLPKIHPGEILLEEFMIPLSLSHEDLSFTMNIPQKTLRRLTNGQEHITPESAERLSQYFGTSIQFWMNLQTQFNQ